jgi:enoyl-CoA hydratase
VVDVALSSDYRRSHIPGSWFSTRARLADNLKRLPKADRVVIASPDGALARFAAAELRAQGLAAAARGAAVGAGAGLLTACDLAVVGTDLRLSYPENRLGLVPALVATGLQRRAGVARAFELLTLSRVIDADEALRSGVVNRVVPPDQVEDAALEIAEVWAATPAPVLAATKALLRRIADLPFAQALEEGARVNAAARSGKAGAA